MPKYTQCKKKRHGDYQFIMQTIFLDSSHFRRYSCLKDGTDNSLWGVINRLSGFCLKPSCSYLPEIFLIVTSTIWSLFLRLQSMAKSKFWFLTWITVKPTSSNKLETSFKVIFSSDGRWLFISSIVIFFFSIADWFGCCFLAAVTISWRSFTSVIPWDSFKCCEIRGCNFLHNGQGTKFLGIWNNPETFY